MRVEDWVSTVFTKGEGRIDALKKGLPLGLGLDGEILLSQRREKTITTRHTCVTGAGRTAFLQSLVFTLSCLYEKKDAAFLIISPYKEYENFLFLKTIDATVPYIRQKSHVEQAIKTLQEVKRTREYGGAGYPHLFVVVDGVDGLQDCNANADLEELRAVLELLSHREDVDVLCGVELVKSIFSGYPGAFVGIGNCLVTAEEDGRADLAYVEDDASLSGLITLEFPVEKQLSQTVAQFNAIAVGEKE